MRGWAAFFHLKMEGYTCLVPGVIAVFRVKGTARGVEPDFVKNVEVWCRLVGWLSERRNERQKNKIDRGRMYGPAPVWFADLGLCKCTP